MFDYYIGQGSYELSNVRIPEGVQTLHERATMLGYTYPAYVFNNIMIPFASVLFLPVTHQLAKGHNHRLN